MIQRDQLWRIKEYDLFERIRVCLEEYKKFHELPMKPKTKKTWRCFHCDEVFTDLAAARDHFGASILDQPSCQTDAMRLRALEKELRRYRNEDTDLHRQIAHLQTEHQTALMRAEESGYAKGLKDGREMVEAPATIPTTEREGYDALWLWFDISRAGWLTIPRVLLHEMPDAWQGKMAALLREYERTFTNWPEGIGTRVLITDGGTPTRLYNWLLDYRHPAKSKINNLRPEEKP